MESKTTVNNQKLILFKKFIIFDRIFIFFFKLSNLT
jgi:hypothetical protein